MSTRVLLAGILGGIAMFVWSAIAHMVLPLGEAGFREIPDEQSVVGAMNSAIGDQAGFYIFPGPGLGPDRPPRVPERNPAVHADPPGRDPPVDAEMASALATAVLVARKSR